MLNIGTCILWNIWKARNELIFNIISVQLCMNRDLQDFKVFDLHRALNYCNNICIVSATNIVLECPPPLVIKVNVDAAFKNGKGGVVSVAKDSFGHHIGCGSICFGTPSSTVAEAKAYSFGLQLASKLQVTKIIVEGDATDIPNSIAGSTDSIPWCIRSIIPSIRDRVKALCEVSFTAFPRDANSILHNLAQSAISNFAKRWWVHNEPPNCIMQRLIFGED
ncbi:uncharacterized protein LOC113343906 [Papaver somniferum]|uniref:uncharacterized protein LOC113343906 n=1 Tax=Papaver somniferum TaxID=3469 RepID=UPI000E6F6F8A|nr:uncharacterized protein LOC113343906 [Papaver somniferum]